MDPESKSSSSDRRFKAGPPLKKLSSSRNLIKKSKSDFINGLKTIVKVSKVFSGDKIEIQFTIPRINDENSGSVSAFFKTGLSMLKSPRKMKNNPYITICNIYGIVSAPIYSFEGLQMKYLLEYMIFERDGQNGILYGILKTTTSHKGLFIELYCDEDFERSLYPTPDDKYHFWKAKNLNFLIKKLKKLNYRNDVIKYIELYSETRKSFLLAAPYEKRDRLNYIKIIPGYISQYFAELFDG